MEHSQRTSPIASLYDRLGWKLDEKETTKIEQARRRAVEAVKDGGAAAPDRAADA